MATAVPLVSLWINKQKYKPRVILFSSLLSMLLFVQFSFPFHRDEQGCSWGSLVFFFTFFLLLMLVLSCRREAPSTTLRCAQPTALCLTRLLCTLIFITKNSLPIERVSLIIAFNASVSRLTLFFFCSVYRHFQRVCIFIVGPFVCPCSIVFSVIRLRLTCFWLFNY